MKSINKKTFGFWILIVFMVLVVLSFIIRFEEKVAGPARLASQYEWTIIHLEQDKISTLYKSNGLVQKQQVELFHLSRPDYITFSIKDGLAIGRSLNQGEMVAQFVSLEDQYRITNLQGDLEQAKAQLSAQSTGLKRAQQEEADQELQFSKAQLEAYRPIVERQRELYKKHVISRQELEISEAQNQLYEIDVALQEARVRSARSGEKSELLSIFQAQITAAANELSLLNNKAAASMIHAPFSGILVQPVDSLGEKLHLCKNDTFVVQMAVDAAHIHSIKAGQPLTIKLLSHGARMNTTVSGISQAAIVIQRQPMFMVYALIDNQENLFYHGIPAAAAITTGKATLFRLLQRSWHDFRINN